MVVDKEMLLALAAYDGQGAGSLQVYSKLYEPDLRALFEKTVVDDGKPLPAWSPQAVAYLLERGLRRAGFAGIEDEP